MAAFLYYLPGLRAAGRQQIERAGLGHAFDDSCSAASREVSAGPDGQAGVVVADAHRLGQTVGYFADRQAWRRVPGSTAWVGHYLGALPGPDDLARPEERRLDGHPVRLGDGRIWIVPIVRGVKERDGEPVPYVPLPRRIGCDEDGRTVFRGVIAEHQGLWEAAGRWWDFTEAAGPSATIAWDEIVTIALAGLAGNYRLRLAVEADLLGLFSQPNVREVCDAMIDLPGWKRWLKKKEASGGSSTADGSPDSPRDTDRVSPTSTP